MKNKKQSKTGKEKFSEWQSEVIRAAAISFLAANASAGHLSTMLSMAQEIEEFRTGKYANEKSDKLYFLKQERLRRFLAGHNLGNDKQAVLKDFLIAEEMLTKDDLNLDLDDTREFLKVHSFLAQKNEEAKLQLKILDNKLSSSRLYHTVSETVSFNIKLDPSGLFFRVVENFIQNVPAKTLYHVKIAVGRDKGKVINSIRRGYGLISTKGYLIHIFLRGKIREDQITYIQSSLFPDMDDHGAKFFIRFGDPVTLSSHDESKLDEFKREINIYKFYPSAPKPAKGKD